MTLNTVYALLTRISVNIMCSVWDGVRIRIKIRVWVWVRSSVLKIFI